MRSLVVGIMLATASVYADPAPTAPTEEAKARGKEIYTAGTKQYDLRDYAAAIQSFRQAYDLIPEPLFLFDIAQSYRQLHDCENAGSFYKTYLRNLPTADNRDQVERFIATMDDCVREDQARAAERARIAAVAGVPKVVTPPPRHHRGLVIGGVVIAISGIAIAGTGIYFSVDAANQARHLEASCQFGCEGADVAAIDQRGRDSDRDAVIAYAIGAAALGTGIGMILWAALDTDEPVTITPTSGGAMISTKVTF